MTRRIAVAWLSLMVAAFGLSIPTAATAQDQRGLHIIAPLAPGSTFDLLARALGTRLEQRMHQTVVVENRPGANMSIAANACKNAAPDGHTICLFTHNLFLNPLLKANLGYDPVKDLVPVAALAYLEQVFVVNRRVPVKTFAELVAYSKAHPNTLNYGSVGVGSAAHLVIEWLRKASGGDWKHVPFNGAPQVQTAMASGDVHMTFTPSGNVIGRIKSGDLVPLLTAGDKRNPLLPDVPTFAEAGLPSLPAKSWAGMFAPVGTPAAVVAKLNHEFSEIIAEKAFQERLTKLGLGPAPMQLAAFKTFIVHDQAAWAPLIKETGLAPK